MSDFVGNFLETSSYWNPPSSPTPGTILAMLNETENDQNPITEIFPQTNLQRDLSEKRSGLGERLAARIETFCLPPLQTENISPFAAFFRNSTLPSPVFAFSPGFSPSALLQSPNICSHSSQINPPPSSVPPETVESCGATTMILNNDLPHQPLQVDPPPEEGNRDASVDIQTEDESHVEPISAPLVSSFESGVVDENNIINIISMEEDDEDEDEDMDSVDVEPSIPKRRKFDVLSNMVGATRKSKQQRVIIQMECEEDNPDDGFRWRKYGRKVVRGNPNPRSYYKCTFDGCKVKKHVERGAEDVKLIVTTYDGIHNHTAPSGRRRKYGPRNWSGSSSIYQNHIDRTSRLGRTTTLSFTTSSLSPQFDMTGLSKLPSLPGNHNSGFVNRNDEPKIDDGTEVFKGIRHRLFLNFGLQF